MYLSETWLRELVNPKSTTEQLAHQLTMAGLEIGSIEKAAPEFSGVVIGQVVSTEQHPDAEKLKVCQVDVADKQTLSIVCGAPNVKAGLTVAVAKIGARLPGKVKIRKAKLRGVESQGMICSSRELGLGDEHDGILELPEMPLGQDFRDALQLDDTLLELELTPNRGDCLGMFGVARELAALNSMAFEVPVAKAIAATHDRQINVHLESPSQCPRYAGRVITNIRTDAITPLWMAERLRRAGLRTIHPVVDITNYVMLESGKPMHGFDLATMKGDVRVRNAAKGEKLTLLDGRELELNENILVIADDSGARALAGIMGGIDTGVNENTTDVFFESAYFDPLAIAGKARLFGLHTDASHRFERGVDPNLCVDSIERATQLLLEICGGEAGPVTLAEDAAHLPEQKVVTLEQAHLERLIGRAYDKITVHTLLSDLGMQVSSTESGWKAIIPSHRFDLDIPEDLIEEVVRVVGYDKVEEQAAVAELAMGEASESHIAVDRIKNTLVSFGYFEAITYSFVDPTWHAKLVPEIEPLALANPISADLSVMRASLLPGLLAAVKSNQSRQKRRVRLFECGLSFVPQDTEIKQENMLAIIASGDLYPEQWDAKNRAIDFFDFKNDVANLLEMGAQRDEIVFVAEQNPVFHPGQCARIYRQTGADRQPIGWIGALHPQIQSELEIDTEVMFTQLDIVSAFAADIPVFINLSKYPEVRRDLAVVVNEDVTVDEILSAVRSVAPASLKELRLFDVYRGQGIEAGAKSIALGLILQESSRTLTDVDADSAVAAITTHLQKNLHAKIRD